MVDSGRTIQHRLLALARDAHAGGLHEAAYHALAGALHAAEAAGDMATIAAVMREAATQVAWIDEHLPEHRMSSSSTAAHGNPGGYGMLLRQARNRIAAAPPAAGSEDAHPESRGPG